MKMISHSTAGVVVVSLLWSAAARADDLATETPTVADTERATPVDTKDAAARGAFVLFTNPAGIGDARAHAVTIAGYDSVRSTGTFESATEVRVWGPLSLRAGAVYTNGDRTLRPSVGGRLQALREGRHGVDLAAGVFYRPEGLTEPEGEIESVVSVGRHLGSVYALGNLLYGQDPEGNERDCEVRVAALRPTGSRFLLGIDGRVRFDLGSNAATLARHNEATFDSYAGPLAGAQLGPVMVSAQGGPAVMRRNSATSYGAFAVLGVGSAF